MPDPKAYLTALAAAALFSAGFVLAVRLLLRKSDCPSSSVIFLAAVGVGSVMGFNLLQFSSTWPPANALNRFLTIVLPATVIVELLAGVVGVFGSAPQKTGHRQNAWLPRPLVLVLRLALCASVGPILLYGSVYLSGVSSENPEAWTLRQSISMHCGGMLALIATWSALSCLSQRSAPGSITLSLALAILCAGITTMMAGYIKGGAAAIPLAAALIGTTLATPLPGRGIPLSGNNALQGPLGIGVIALFSLLCIGRFFGQLTSLSAIIIFLSPLLCWISEIPRLRQTALWKATTIRLIAVTIPLASVLFVAKQDFDHKMGPLLTAGSHELP